MEKSTLNPTNVIARPRLSARPPWLKAKARPALAALAASLSWLAAAVPGQASSLTWNAGGADQNFNNPANWGGSAPNTGDAVTFGSNFDGVPLLNVDENLARVLFHDTSGSPSARTLGTLVSPKTLTLTSLSGDGAIQVFDNFTETINANMVLSSGSTSTFFFSPDNPSGVLTHAGVKLNGTLSGGATNNNLTTGNFPRPFLLDFSSAGAASGTGTTTLNTGVRLRIANTNQIFSGSLVVNAGTIEWAGASDLTMSLGTGAGQINASTSLGFAAIGGTRGVNIGGNGTPDTLTTFPASMSFGSIDADGTLEFKNPLNRVAGINIVTVDGPAAVEARLLGPITVSGSNQLNFTGNGTIRLSAANSVTFENLNVAGGTVLVDTPAALGSSGNIVTVFDGPTSGTSNASLLTNAAINVTQGVWIFPLSTGVATVGGNTADSSIFSGSVMLGNGTAHDLNVSAASGGTVNFSGIIDERVGVSNAANVAKSGAGKVIFSNANAYNGTTTVNAGTFVADNNAAFSTGAVTVNSGGKLETATGRTITNAITVNSGGAIGGFGTFNPTGGVTLASGAQLSPGDSIGTVTFGSNGLTMTNGAVYDWEWSLSSQDLTSVTGLLTLSGTLTLDVTKFGAGPYLPPFTPVDYVIMTYGTLSNTATWNVLLPSGWSSNGVVVDSANNRLILSAMETPEPATAGVLAVGCLLIGRRRARC